MKKDFDKWNNKKKEIDNTISEILYHSREVWWCAIGTNVGFEQDGTGKNFDRPVVIIKGFSKDMFFGVMLTGKNRSGKYYFPLGIIGNRPSSAILSQVRLIDVKRLVRKISTLDSNLFKDLKRALIGVLFSEEVRNSLPPSFDGGEAEAICN